MIVLEDQILVLKRDNTNLANTLQQQAAEKQELLLQLDSIVSPIVDTAEMDALALELEQTRAESESKDAQINQLNNLGILR